ncbi:hypothetical protein BCP01_061 [Bacillus phage BCP01]|nr:hypothetical protein BCP01_061 [Bacillus phage BCP01]
MSIRLVKAITGSATLPSVLPAPLRNPLPLDAAVVPATAPSVVPAPPPNIFFHQLCLGALASEALPRFQATVLPEPPRSRLPPLPPPTTVVLPPPPPVGPPPRPPLPFPPPPPKVLEAALRIPADIPKDAAAARAATARAPMAAIAPYTTGGIPPSDALALRIPSPRS